MRIKLAVSKTQSCLEQVKVSKVDINALDGYEKVKDSGCYEPFQPY